MRKINCIVMLGFMVWPTASTAVAADLRALTRDSAKERWVKDLLRQYFGLTIDIRVVRDPELEDPDNEVCAYATVRHGHAWIAYGADCINKPLIPINAAAGFAASLKDWWPTACFLHEAGHILSLHGFGSGKKNEWTRQLEAERFTGFALRLLGAPYSVAQNYGQAGAEDGRSWMPPRAQRAVAVDEGWRMFGASRRTAPPTIPLLPAVPESEPETTTAFSWPSWTPALLAAPALLLALWGLARASTPAAPGRSYPSRRPQRRGRPNPRPTSRFPRSRPARAAYVGG